MPVPDPIPTTTATPNGDIEHFQLLHNDHVHNFNPLTASKLTTPHIPPQQLDLATEKPLTNGAFSSLKAIPLASYYKLHRVPSLGKLAEEHIMEDNVKLPRRESTAAPEPPQNGVQNKMLEQVIRTPGRQPSPQPTHLSVPGASQSRMLHEEGSGYVAPKFEGKESQMDEGKDLVALS